MNWTVLTTAPDQMTGEMWVDLLKTHGIPCKLHPGDVTGFLGVAPHAVRIVVPESEAERAFEYLSEVVDLAEADER